MITVTTYCITIEDCHAYSKHSFDSTLDGLRSLHPFNVVLTERSNKSLSREWASHILAYNLHLFRSHTKDADLQYPLRWWEKVLYPIVGTFALWVIKQ